MAQYFYTPSSGTVTDWTARWHSNSTFSFDTDHIDMANSSNSRRLMSIDTIDSTDVTSPGADVEVVLLFKVSNVTDAQAWAVLRGSGNSTSETGYFFGAFGNAGEWRLRYYNNATQATLSSASYTFNTTDVFAARLYSSGTSIKAKIWNFDTESEPASWTTEVTDSTISGSGWVGVGNFVNDNIEIHGFGLGTGGDSAPTSASTTLTGTSTFTFPVHTMDSTGELEHTSTSTFTFPVHTMDSTGELEHTSTSTFTFPVLAMDTTGELEHTSTSTFTFPVHTMDSTGGIPQSQTATSTFTLPALSQSSSASVFTSATATSTFTFPAFSMEAKAVIPRGKGPILSPIASGYRSSATWEEWRSELGISFENTVSRDGSTPNQMLADFDLNSNDILNTRRVYAEEVYLDGVRLNDQGIEGPQGPQGEAGPTGSDGPQGPQGETGPQGIQGITGSAGPKGDTGATGATGPTGATGATGDQGPKGDTGATGAQGPVGASLSILGTLASTGDLPASGATGEGYIIGGEFHVWDGSSYVNVGQVQGPKGDNGEAVTLRNTGTVIQFGFAGGQSILDSDDDEIWDSDDEPLIDMFAPSTWNDLIDVADLVGATGPTGATGAAGSDGADGVTPVLSTNGVSIIYSTASNDSIDDSDDNPITDSNDEAILESNTDDWVSIVNIDSLSGPQGPQGADGPQGPTGAQGPAGAAGADGVDGTNGLDGADGADGAPGAVGPTGPQGDPGPGLAADETFTSNGTTTVYSLTLTTASDALVYVSGIAQPPTSVTFTNTTGTSAQIQFSEAPPTNTVILVTPQE